MRERETQGKARRPVAEKGKTYSAKVFSALIGYM
jgi:hypothetical protein